MPAPKQIILQPHANVVQTNLNPCGAVRTATGADPAAPFPVETFVLQLDIPPLLTTFVSPSITTISSLPTNLKEP